MRTVASWEAVMASEDLLHAAPSAEADPRAKDARPLAVRREEAARMLGIGIDSLDEHVLPEIQIVRLNRMVLVPVEELRGWVARRAARVGADW